MGTNLAALVWGFGEATLFFLIPDVLLSWVALRDGRPAWVACGWATAGALAGGALMYGWGGVDRDSAVAALDYVPAINRDMIDSVEEQINNHGIGALFFGPLTGTPYKIYAVQAGAGHLGLASFLLVSAPVRLA